MALGKLHVLKLSGKRCTLSASEYRNTIAAGKRTVGACALIWLKIAVLVSAIFIHLTLWLRTLAASITTMKATGIAAVNERVVRLIVCLEALSARTNAPRRRAAHAPVRYV